MTGVCGEPWWNDIDREKTEYLGEKPVSCFLPHPFPFHPPIILSFGAI
jgi:hypothetical protein